VAVVGLAALLAFAGDARAQFATSLNRSGSGARAAGMANAFVAVSDDGTAASWNPAGLAQLRKPEFSLVYSTELREIGFSGMRSADGTVAFSNRDVHASSASPEFVSAALPLTVARRPMTIQVGWQRIYQLSNDTSGEVLRLALRDPAAVPQRILLTSDSKGDIDRGSLSVAMKPWRGLSAGVSLNLWRGSWQDNLAFVEPGSTTSDFLAIRAATSIRGENVTAGLLYASTRLSAGFVYNWPFWSSYDVHQENRSNQLPAASYTSGPDAEFRFPKSLGVGVAWRPAPRWTVALCCGG
jgi:hypothetical protein